MRDVTMPKEFDGAEKKKKKKTLNTHAYIYTIIITYHTRTLNVMVLNVMILFDCANGRIKSNYYPW